MGGDGDQWAPHDRVLARAGRSGHQGVAPGQRDVPVVAVLGAPRPDSPQINGHTRDISQSGKIGAGHRVGEQVAALEIDRDHIGRQFADLAARHAPG